MKNNLHAHVSWYATDCDGPLSGSYLMTMTEEEATREFADIEFHNRVVAHIVNTYSIFQTGTLEVTSGEGSEDIDPETLKPIPNTGFVVNLEWDEQTEEGHRSTNARLCKDSRCDLDVQPTRRDHRAESMGY